MENRKSFSRMITQDNFVTEKIDVIKNGLLGDYDDDGNYIIPTQIVDELIALEKVKKTSFGNSVFCAGRLPGFGEISFELLFDSKTRGGISASATLFLLEEVYKINGYLQNTIRTKLEVFENNVDNFIETTYKHFNIIKSDSDGREKLSEEVDDSYILAKYEYTQMLNKLLDDKFLDAYGKYFTYRFSVLTKMDNDFSKSVLDKFNSRYALIENVFLQEKNYKTLNELLDMSVEEVSGLDPNLVEEEKKYRENITPALDVFELSVDKLNDKYGAKALNMLDENNRDKVEKMLNDDAVQEIDSKPATKQSAERMISEVNTDVAESKPVTLQDEPKSKEQKTLDEVEEPKQIVENKKEPNFYETFISKENAEQTKQKAENTAEEQTLDTVESNSSELQEEPHQEETTISTLKDRMSRLEKFKVQQENVENYINKELKSSTEKKNDDKIGSVFEKLAQEKEKKSEQVSEKYSKNMENMTKTESELALEELKKRREQEQDLEM